MVYCWRSASRQARTEPPKPDPMTTRIGLSLTEGVLQAKGPTYPFLFVVNVLAPNRCEYIGVGTGINLAKQTGPTAAFGLLNATA